jgi:polyisoprenoid-binding protein YceI
MKYKITLFTFLGFGTVLLLFVYNKTNTIYNLATIQIEVDGTSNLRSWHTSTTTASGLLDINLENGILKKINSVTIKIPSESLKSGNASMDKHTYEALKTKAYPEIIYFLTKSTIKPIKTEKTEIITIGNLEIAGEKRLVEINVIGEIKEQNKIQISGKYNLNMTDYNIEPPTALLGTVKAHEVVTISFKITFEIEKQPL